MNYRLVVFIKTELKIIKYDDRAEETFSLYTPISSIEFS
jgi:hypothetical protein